MDCGRLVKGSTKRWKPPLLPLHQKSLEERGKKWGQHEPAAAVAYSSQPPPRALMRRMVAA